MIAVQVGPFCSVCESMELCPASWHLRHWRPSCLSTPTAGHWAMGWHKDASDQPLPWFLGALSSLHTEEIESERTAPVPRETGRSNGYCLGMLT